LLGGERLADILEGNRALDEAVRNTGTTPIEFVDFELKWGRPSRRTINRSCAAAGGAGARALWHLPWADLTGTMDLIWRSFQRFLR
jgi:hypothetical protein